MVQLLADDVIIHFIRQFDASRRADRYALHSCLQVSHRFFELAAERLWSVKTLTDDYKASDLDINLLLSRVANHDPPTLEDAARSPGGLEWRLLIYTRALRAMKCPMTAAAYGDPSRLLSWLPRLESVDAFHGNEDWAQALARRFGAPHRPLRHLRLDCYASWSDFKALVRPGLRSLSLGTPTDEGVAELLEALMTGDGDRQLETLSIGNLRRGDVKAVVRCVEVHGGTLRRLTVCGLALHRLGEEVEVEVFRPACRLLAVRVELDYDETAGMMTLASGLLASNHATLVECEITGRAMEVVESLPMSRLRSLRSLSIRIYLPDGFTSTPWLTSMTSLRELAITLNKCSLDGVVALMDAVKELTGLRSLHVFIREQMAAVGDKEIRLRMRHLQKLELYWKLDNGTSAVRVLLIDCEEIERDGLPQLEELVLDLSARTDRWEFPRAFHDAVLRQEMTPALVFVNIRFNSKNRFGWTGGRRV